eukprot:596193-Lingulodinium_polyedra.AAC.1
MLGNTPWGWASAPHRGVALSTTGASRAAPGEAGAGWAGLHALLRDPGHCEGHRRTPPRRVP